MRESGASSLDDLCDAVLIEILRRLPTVKSAVGFKLVSKRWCSLISTPHFVSQFIAHHIEIQKRNNTIANSVIVCPQHSIAGSPADHKLLFIVKGEQYPIFESSRSTFTLDFLATEWESVSVVASCNDSLLCRSTKRWCLLDLYVCNPYTKQWLLLPSGDLIPDFKSITWFGLVYEADYERLFRGIDECRFRIVSLKRSSRDRCSQMQIYHSESRRWNDSCPLDDEHEARSNIVAYDGMLYWYGFRGLVAYDPVNSKTVLIDGSDPEEYNTYNKPIFSIYRTLGICFYNKLPEHADSLAVWELCTETTRLNLKVKIFLDPQPAIRYYKACCWTLALHPYEEDLVYAYGAGHIMTWKINNGKLEVLPYMIPLASYASVCHTRPWLPTPLPTQP